MPRITYDDPKAEAAYQSARDKLAEGLKSYGQQDDETMPEYVGRAVSREAYQSGDYTATGNYSPTKMRK